MKLIFIILICISLLISNTSSLKEESKRGKAKHLTKHKYKFRNGTGATNKTKSTNSTNSTNSSDEPKEPKIATIPFGPKANKYAHEFNSVGTKVDNSVILDSFPFKIQRCDSIVYFPCAFINNMKDYRQRKVGFVSITAHYTNLYADKDGQKLIQQVLHTLMPNLPRLVSGAEGCIQIQGDKGQKKMIICVPTQVNAINLLKVYEDFTRCRLGDNLTDIPPANLKALMKLCNVDISQLTVDPTVGKNQANNLKNIDLKAKENQRKMRKARRDMLLRKKNNAEFELPSEEANKWEQDRLSYFMPNKLRVPGQRNVVPMPPGLLPITNPGIIDQPLN